LEKRSVLKRIHLNFCDIFFEKKGHTTTCFHDGTQYGAYPHYTVEYKALAERLGYDSVEDYCQEHEFCHNFLPEILFGKPSRVLWPLAHGQVGTTEEILAEEALCVMFQGFLKRDIVMAATAPKINWWEIRLKAKELIDGTSRA
jgi:hypothetical protein